MTIFIPRTEHSAAEHARRIIRERREREAGELRRANARPPHVDARGPRPARSAARGLRRETNLGPCDDPKAMFDSPELCERCGSWIRFVVGNGCVNCDAG